MAASSPAVERAAARMERLTSPYPAGAEAMTGLRPSLLG
jgi:hypothetical protein